jgi:hypothetical protein
MKNKKPIDIMSINRSIPKEMQPCFYGDDGLPIISSTYDGHKHHDVDSRLIYRVNNYGYHGVDFVENSDILALGCSVTAGLGIPYELTWPHLVAKELNETVNVIGIPGAGVDQIFRNCLLYMKIFGKPKKIMLLMPDFYRAWIPILEDDKTYDITPLLWCYETKEYLKTGEPIIYKDWYGIHRSIPAEVVGSNVILNIKNFQILCNLLEIDFSFFSWDLYNTNYLLKQIKGVENYNEEIKFNGLNFFAPQYYFDEYEKSNCHHSSKEEHQVFWDRALDHPRSHPGMHAQIHYAEMFLGKKISQKTIEESTVKNEFS